ncbi:serine/threonine-protein phosphatase 6 regulatory ankyrin repeat subunit B-like [Coccinella septempunctata]|uniref:serine/threonine-protein phosphatase 6 regulatory ankyrin repeat subunit B-like n=1 Tax=Coccinella septempunctata TaxID=41139 RepID=UPI001D0856E5|nr:serine/threonine-protein phosphatase 6 regulatory ankyrin repeat subunit B-like [Coccinella septempunctata]
MENILYYVSDFVTDKLAVFASDEIAVGKDESYPLHDAVAEEDIMKIFKLLKSIPVDAEKPRGKTALIEATLRPYTPKNIEIMKLLLRKGADPMKQFQNSCAAYYILRSKNKDMMNFLLKYIKDVNGPILYDLKLIDVASKKGYSEIVEALIDMGADLTARNYQGMTYLHQAAFNEEPRILKILLDAGMDVNAQDNYSRTAVHYAAAKKNLLSLQVLLEKNPNINAVDRRHNTPANVAAKENFYNYYDVLKVLLEHGCDINIPDEFRNTPLHNLFLRYHPIPVGCVSLLIDHGAEINALNSFSSSALHLAVRGNHELICDLLIRKGSKMDGKNTSRLTPLEMNARSSPSVLCVVKHLAIVHHLRKEKLNSHMLGIINSDPISREFWNNCCDEIAQLDNCKVQGSNLNYTMLYFLNRKVINSLRNEEFCQKISSSELSAFPIYGNILYSNFLTGYRARMWEESAEQYLYTLFRDRLPYDCIRDIVTFFSIKDLELLVQNNFAEYRMEKERKKNRYFSQYLLVMHVIFIGAALMVK